MSRIVKFVLALIIISFNARLLRRDVNIIYGFVKFVGCGKNCSGKMAVIFFGVRDCIIEVLFCSSVCGSRRSLVILYGSTLFIRIFGVSL